MTQASEARTAESNRPRLGRTRGAETGDDFRAALRLVVSAKPMRITLLVFLTIALLATGLNVALVKSPQSLTGAKNAFTGVNGGVFFALLVALFLTTRPEHAELLRSYDNPVVGRQRLGAHARAAALVGAACTLAMGVAVVLLAVLLLKVRGIPVPSSQFIASYLEREVIAAARLAVVGIAVGAIIPRPRYWFALGIAILVVDAILEAVVPGFRIWGPMGALNALSDPSHHHQFSMTIGGLIALGWAALAVVAASAVIEARHRRATQLASTSSMS